MDADQARAFVDAMVNAAAAAAAAAANAAVAPQPPQPVPFALLPGAANVNPLDWSKAEAMKLFHKATFALDPKFGMKEETLRTFIEQIRERSRIYNWDYLLTVPDAATVGRNLLDRYGMVTMADCQAYATNHVGLATATTNNTRLSQDSMMLYQFLLNSLSESAKLAMLSDKESYYINDFPSGVCFLKAIIGRSSIDTNAKVTMLRKRIAKLADTMQNEYKGNVRDINIYVAEQRDQLRGRGHEVNELLTHLFDAYLNGVNDEEFHRYIESYQNQHDDGAVINPDTLMHNALTKYDTIMQRREIAGESENKIMALYAEKRDEVIEKLLEKLEVNMAQSKNNNNSNKGKAFNKKIPEWKKVAPGENDPKTIVKTVNDKKKTFHWCPNHQMWCIHTAKECTYKKDGKEGGSKSNEDPKLVLNKALLAFLNQDIEE